MGETHLSMTQTEILLCDSVPKGGFPIVSFVASLQDTKNFSEELHGSMGFDSSAVSTLISVVLMLGLLVSVISLINVYYVPSWIRDGEAAHARDTFVDFSSISECIDNLVLANDTDVVRRQRIALGGGDIPIISHGKSWGTLGVSPEGKFGVSADVLVENVLENTTTGNIGDGSVNLTNISSISSFYIDISKIQNVSGGFPTTFQYITVNFTNQSGKVELLIRPDKNHLGEAKSSLQLSTWLGESNDTYKIIDRLYINRSVDALKPLNYRIDLLNPCYGFNKVLSDATTPYNLTITNSTDIDGEKIYYTIKFNEYNKTTKSYTKIKNGILMYGSRNRYFIDQTSIYQNGAIFLCQPPNASMRIGSGIMINNGDGFTNVVVPLISVNTTEHGTPMISGSGVEELQMGLDNAKKISFADGTNTANVHVTIEPPDGEENFRKNYLKAWADHFNEMVRGTSIQLNPPPVYAPDYTSINITLNGSIHLEIKDIAIKGRIATITS